MSETRRPCPTPTPEPAAATPAVRRAVRVLAGHRQAVQRAGIAGVFALVAAGALAATAAPAATPAAAPRHRVAARSVLPVALTPSSAAPAPTTPGATPVAPAHAAAFEPADSTVISGLAANGIPSVALNAYRVAAARLSDAEPGCGIPWYLLAGIGREESDHGRFGGAVLHSDGLSTPRIIGPALDGKTWDLIPAPANGLALDGDAVYAHALGPMQFIPSTWAGYGADADGDGKADIFDINDAALGAGRYLCAAGGNLRTKAGQTRAVLAYNHNAQYVAQVLALADAYHRGISIVGLPVGITKGALPKVKKGPVPPADPAAPTAGAPSTSGSGVTRSSGTPSPTAPSTSRSSAAAGHSSSPAPTATHTSTPAPAPKPSSSSPTAPSSKPASPSPTQSCDPTQLMADEMLPTSMQTCANEPTSAPSSN